ncbi:hypothetical protein [Micromonospora sp. NBC_01412]|uniref:hypothetical protein n=1 Tax=Micromonospora sp. NBC_01412 TaxID=2903590 RepID=UPI00324F38CD
MADVVEIHIPLVPTPGLPVDAYPFPWIERIEDFLVGLDEAGQVEVPDDGEQYDGNYVFFIAGANEDVLLKAASRVAALDGVPAGAFAMVTRDDAEEMGLGRHVDLPLPAPSAPRAHA